MNYPPNVFYVHFLSEFEPSTRKLDSPFVHALSDGNPIERKMDRTDHSTRNGAYASTVVGGAGTS